MTTAKPFVQNTEECKFLTTKGLAVYPASHDDLESIAALEAAAFAPADQASPETIRKRLELANPFFLLLRDVNNGRLVAFVNGTCCQADVLKHEFMYTHDPEGQTLCVHSIAVDAAYRRQGIALNLLKFYIQHIREFHNVRRVLLLARPPVTELYAKAGFRPKGWSQVAHGDKPWIEMEMLLEC